MEFTGGSYCFIYFFLYGHYIIFGFSVLQGRRPTKTVFVETAVPALFVLELLNVIWCGAALGYALHAKK